MKEFIQMLRRYVTPYKKYLGGAIILNILSALFNIFSFTMMIPMLRILFKMNTESHVFIPLSGIHSVKAFGEALINNTYYWLEHLMVTIGPSWTLLILCASLGIATLLKTASYFGSSAIMIPIRTGIVRDLRLQMYQKLMELPLGFFSQERKGDIIARMTGDIGEVQNSIMNSLDMLIKNPILILFYFCTLLFVSWKLTIFTILVVPALGWFMGVVGKQLKRDSLETQALWSDTMSQVEETLGGFRVIKAFIAEKKMSQRFSNVTAALRQKSGKVMTRQALAHPMSEFLGTILIMIVLWFGGMLILGDHSPIDAPTFMFYMVILYSILNPIKEFSRASYSIPRGMASMERIDKILKAHNNITDPLIPEFIDEFNDKIKIDDVSFCYEPDRQILKNINVEIKKGATIAIVGESGAGKSTLVDLIPRFYDVTKGSILIDGINIKNVRMNDLRSLIGYVNQEPILFNDTIFNNIAFGVKDAGMDQVIEAAKIANAHEFIMEKPDGYNTNIGDRGMLLSGGQRQRISIARAILKNPPILILDEATASLDTESERLVQEALDRLMSNRTTIAIAHRLSTIKNSDEILVMQEGEIVERGRHEDLLALGGYYKKLNDMQVL